MKIIVIDDHPLVTKGLMNIFSLEPNFEFAGEARNVTDALVLMEKVKPDLSIVDLRLGYESGFDVIVRAREKKIICKFMILTSSADMNDFQVAQEERVEAYVLKEALPEEILYALRVVKGGRNYYDPGIMQMALGGMRNENIYKLTPREKDVLVEIGRGLKNTEIAKKLFITEYTVKKHVSQILDKLNLTDRTQAALYANNIGLVKYQ